MWLFSNVAADLASGSNGSRPSPHTEWGLECEPGVPSALTEDTEDYRSLHWCFISVFFKQKKESIKKTQDEEIKQIDEERTKQIYKSWKEDSEWQASCEYL